MKKIQKTLELLEYSFEELSSEQKNLVENSQKAFEFSYSPYSNFPVGAAILLNSGEVIKGSNQENAAYPSGLCAERVALFNYGANFKDQEIAAMAISIKNPINTFAFPCGSCLQVISEYENKQSKEFEIIISHPSEDKYLISKGVSNLLPFSFKKENLI